MLGFIAGKPWHDRTVKVFASETLQYYNDDTLKGQVKLTGAEVKKVTTEETVPSQEHAFEIITKSEGSLSFATSSEEETDAWIAVISLIASGKGKVFELAEILEIPLPEIIDVVADRNDLNDCLAKSNYGLERFNEIIYDSHIDNLISKLRTFNAQDPVEFLKLFKSRFAAKKLILRPYSDDDADQSRYYKSSFTPEGELLIQFKRSQVFYVI